jgi:hypothetical protein
MARMVIWLITALYHPNFYKFWTRQIHSFSTACFRSDLPLTVSIGAYSWDEASLCIGWLTFRGSGCIGELQLREIVQLPHAAPLPLSSEDLHQEAVPRSSRVRVAGRRKAALSRFVRRYRGTKVRKLLFIPRQSVLPCATKRVQGLSFTAINICMTAHVRNAGLG